MRRSVFSILILILMIFLTVTICFAADESADEEKGQGGLAESIKYLSAALSVGLCAIATGIAQSRIGAAGMGSIVEKTVSPGTVARGRRAEYGADGRRQCVHFVRQAYARIPVCKRPWRGDIDT